MDSSRLSTRVAFVFGLVAWAAGTIGLTGWILDEELLKTLSFEPIAIKTNTALCLIASGLSLTLVSRSTESRAASALAKLLASIPVVVGLATLSEHIFGWDLGIDQWLLKEVLNIAATSSPNRMGTPASVCFPLLGLALVTVDVKRGRDITLAQTAAVLAIIIALIPLLGYIFDVSDLYGIEMLTITALPTTLSLLLLGGGVVLARPEVGITRQFLGDNAAGVMLRRLIPAAILLPILLSRLRVAGERSGLLDQDLGRSLMVLVFILMFCALIWGTAAAVRAQAAARTRAELAQRTLEGQLAASLESERAARVLAERSSHLKNEFLATLSHELRTPLSAISGWAQILMNGQLRPEDARRAYETIQRNALLQAKLVEDLLDMSRIEAGTLRLEFDTVDLGPVVDAALSGARPAMAAKSLTLEQHMAGRAVTVRGDASRLQQIVANLINNAVKFTPRGGRITVGLQATGDMAQISVADTGIGIPEEFLSHVFDRFRQANGSTTRRHGGLGLGLSIARQLAAMHGATLSAHSDGPGRGSTFSLEMPTLDALTHAREPRAGSAHDHGSLDGVRVLVVDDQRDSLDLTERVLSADGAVVHGVENVDDALAALDANAFDVLVSDVSMPERDGYELIQEVRRRGLELPAIALTAFAQPSDVERARAAGFDIHLAKPVPPDRVVKAVAEVYRTGSAFAASST